MFSNPVLWTSTKLPTKFYRSLHFQSPRDSPEWCVGHRQKDLHKGFSPSSPETNWGNWLGETSPWLPTGNDREALSPAQVSWESADILIELARIFLQCMTYKKKEVTESCVLGIWNFFLLCGPEQSGGNRDIQTVLLHQYHFVLINYWCPEISPVTQPFFLLFTSLQLWDS